MKTGPRGIPQALGAIALWSTLAVLVVELGHVPPALLVVLRGALTPTLSREREREPVRRPRVCAFGALTRPAMLAAALILGGAAIGTRRAPGGS